MHRIVRFLSAFLIAFPAASVAAAETPVRGTVVDASGRAVPRALVVVRNTAGLATGQAFTYADGTFRVSADTSAPSGVSGSIGRPINRSGAALQKSSSQSL